MKLKGSKASNDVAYRIPASQLEREENRERFRKRGVHK